MDITRQIFVLIFIIIFFLLVISLMYYNSIKNVTSLINQQQALYNDYEKEIPIENILTGNTLKETFIFYIYIISDNISFSNQNTSKNILKRRGLSFKYNKNKNSFQVHIPYKNLDIQNTNNNFQERSDIIEIINIPNQKWVQIGVILNQRNIDLYIDSKLVKTDIIKNIPYLPKGIITLGEKWNNPNLFLGDIQYAPTNLNQNQLRSLNLYKRLKLDTSLLFKVKKDYLKFRECIFAPSDDSCKEINNE